MKAKSNYPDANMFYYQYNKLPVVLFIYLTYEVCNVIFQIGKTALFLTIIKIKKIWGGVLYVFMTMPAQR